MDKIEALGSTIAQISLYDIKSYYNQAKAVVLNYTEMEAKVRDATNDDPWGASSTVMQEIAQGTFNFQQFNEIMPTIYKRFTEKEAREWRQIYKALQLLEYLIKHGSERVIDDARSHISMIKILKNFHYVDDKGKDQGINVRNRAKEIAELLADVDRVRQERRKAKAARNKYVGTGSDGPSFTSSGGSKYGGFGSDSLGFSGGIGDDWNGGASGSGGRDPYASKNSFKPSDDFEEYDAGEWEGRPAARATRPSISTHRASISSAGATSISVSMKKPTEKATAPAPKAKEVDLFSMSDDDDFTSPAAPVSTNATNVLSAAASLDDEFDEFQSAPPSSNLMPGPAGPTSVGSSRASKPDVFALLNATATSSTTSPAATNNSSSGIYGGSNMSSFVNTSSSTGANMFGSSMIQPMIMNNKPMNHASGPRTGQYNGVSISSATPSNGAHSHQPAANQPKAVGGDQFDDLFTFAGLTKSSSTSTTLSTTNGKPAQAKLSMAAMAREQSSASIWGGGSSSGTPTKPVGMGAPMGSAASSFANGSTSTQNNDDLLL